MAPDPRWHEVVRLAAGFIGVIQQDDYTATELVREAGVEPGRLLEALKSVRGAQRVGSQNPAGIRGSG